MKRRLKLHSYFLYLRYVLRHKYFVFIECKKLGIPFTGLIHDWDKFLPSMFFPYAKYFFGNEGEDISKGRNSTGHYKPYEADDPHFAEAVMRHCLRSKHHWQYWIYPCDGGATNEVMEIPLKYRKEMLADFRGAGKAQGKSDVLGWYTMNGDNLVLGHDTRKWLEENI